MHTVSIDNNIVDYYCDCAIRWKKLFEGLCYDEAIIVIDNEDKSINELTVELIPTLMIEKRLTRIEVLTSQRYIHDAILEKYGKYISCIIYDREELLAFERIVICLNIFGRVYSNIGGTLDGNDPFDLVGYNRLSKKDIIGLFYLRLKNYQGIDARPDRSIISHNLIDRNRYRKYLPLKKYKYDSVKEYIVDTVANYRNKGKITCDNTIIVYGYSIIGCEFLSEVARDYKCYMVDKDSRRHGQVVSDVEIMSPQEVFDHYASEYRVFVAIYHYREVCEYLQEMGYILGQQVFIINYEEDIADFDNDLLIERIEDRFNTGIDTYNNLRNLYPSADILLCSYHASGDVYLPGMYIPEYVKRNSITDFVTVVTSSAGAKIARLLGYETHVITRKEAYSLVSISRLFGYKKLRIHNVNVGVDDRRLLSLCMAVDINTIYQRFCFGDPVKRVKADLHQDDSMPIFSKYNLVPSKTIIIAPYSNTCGNLPKCLTDRIICKAIDMGYSVCTNISAEERPLERTTGLFVPYGQILDFVNKSCMFIGVRSGLCDIISSTDSAMVVFYRRQDRPVYDLVEMGVKTRNILQYNYDELDVDDVIDSISELLDNK